MILACADDSWAAEEFWTTALIGGMVIAILATIAFLTWVIGR